ncbi:hypothetical protein ACOME3_008141 [Neoechinorhynchus agilis]
MLFLLFVYLAMQWASFSSVSGIKCWNAFGFNDDLGRASECQPHYGNGIIVSTAPICIWKLVSCDGDRCVRSFRYTRVYEDDTSKGLQIFIQPAYCFHDDSGNASAAFCSSENCVAYISPNKPQGLGSCCCSRNGCNHDLEIVESVVILSLADFHLDDVSQCDWSVCWIFAI